MGGICSKVSFERAVQKVAPVSDETVSITASQVKTRSQALHVLKSYATGSTTEEDIKKCYDEMQITMSPRHRVQVLLAWIQKE